MNQWPLESRSVGRNPPWPHAISDVRRFPRVVAHDRDVLVPLAVVLDEPQEALALLPVSPKDERVFEFFK